jgi:hypothetical protein
MHLVAVTLKDTGRAEHYPIHRVCLDADVIVVTEVVGRREEGRVVALLDPAQMTGTELADALITALEGETGPKAA